MAASASMTASAGALALTRDQCKPGRRYRRLPIGAVFTVMDVHNLLGIYRRGAG